MGYYTIQEENRRNLKQRRKLKFHIRSSKKTQTKKIQFLVG